jgi:general secretion pathway protein E
LKAAFNEAISQECALFRNGEQYILAVGNPFLAHKSWADDRIDVPRLAPGSSRRSGCFFLKQEQSMRVMDVLPATQQRSQQAGEENLSIKSINEGPAR